MDTTSNICRVSSPFWFPLPVMFLFQHNLHHAVALVVLGLSLAVLHPLSLRNRPQGYSDVLASLVVSNTI